jgi:hypothetical protein
MFNTVTAVPVVFFFVYQVLFVSAENPYLLLLMPLHYTQLLVQLPSSTVSEKLPKQRRKQAHLWNTFSAPIGWRNRDVFHYEREIQSFECVDADYWSDKGEGGLTKFVFV